MKRRKREPLSPERIERLIGRIRIGDMNKLLAERCSGDRTTYELPDDDAGREYLMILLQHYGFTNPHKMGQIIKLRAPWMEIDEVVRTLERVNAYPRKWRADTIGRELRLTNADRLRLGIRTIAAFDITPEERKQQRKLRDRLRKRLRRRTVEHRMRRDEWLVANSTTRTKPWEAAGISRRTWYRQRAKLNGTGVSAKCDGTGVSSIKLSKSCGHTCAIEQASKAKGVAERKPANWPKRKTPARASRKSQGMHQRR
jgi:hypothetical protein